MRVKDWEDWEGGVWGWVCGGWGVPQLKENHLYNASYNK